MIEFAKLKGWVFDIDDTLVLERSYVLSGFAAVSQWLFSMHHIDGFYAAAITRFNAGARGNVFDLAISDLEVTYVPGLIEQMVEIYRSHEPGIELEADAARLIGKLRSAFHIGVISDGPLSSQSRKVTALKLADFASPIILTDAWGREFWKPHPRGFQAIEDAWKINGDALVYVADNPGKDFKAPNSLGWQTIRIARSHGEHVNLQASASEARLTVKSLDEIFPGV